MEGIYRVGTHLTLSPAGCGPRQCPRSKWQPFSKWWQQSKITNTQHVQVMIKMSLPHFTCTLSNI